MKRTLLFCFGLFFTLYVSAQSWQVTGVVTASEDGLPMIGVTVLVKGVTGSGTITDINGKYSIKVPQGKSLGFSYIGYLEQIKEVKANQVLNIVLQSNSKMLDEVVAIGYGTMKKSDLTGAVTSIKSDALQKTPASGLDQALQGRAAGVTVNANSGQPGANAIVRVRGIGSILGGSDPIYVVDGMITSNISFLSPNDIQSTEILKDASSTAIYGSRGANGVILVTTKKGKEGKSNISFNAYTGIQSPSSKLDLMKRDEFVNTMIAMNNSTSESNYFKNNGFNKWLTVYRLGTKSPYYPVVSSTANPSGFDYSAVDTDWQNEVFKSDALIQSYQMSFEGGTEKSQYAISGSYFNQDGTIIGSNYERLTLRINTLHKVRSWLKIGEDLSFMTSTGRNAMNNNSSPGASVISAALAMAPWDPTRYPNGSSNYDGKDLSGQIAASSNFKNVTNPLSMVENSHPTNIVERWVGGAFLDITPFKNLVIRSSLNFDISNNRDKLYKNAYEYSSFDKSAKNFLSTSMSRYSTLIFSNTATYTATSGKHSLSAMVGQTTEEANYYTIGGSGASILNPTENNWFFKQTTEDRAFGDDVWRTRIFSLLGRLHYSYNNKYLITLNFRGDSSSKFPQNLWGYFPSTAVAWRISEESWMKDIKNLDFMKVRFGWGKIGNSSVPSGSFTPKIFSSGPTFVDYVLGANQQLANGATMLTEVNIGGKWETNEQIDLALDFGFFKGLLNGSIDVYQRNTVDALNYVKAPAHIGNRYDAVANIATISNKGIEITLEHQNKIGKLNYNINGNLSLIKNEVTALNGGTRLYGNHDIIDMGYGINTFWGYKNEGIYKTDAEALQHLTSFTTETIPYHAGDAKFSDLNSDGKIDDKDKTDLGNPLPSITYGLNIGADYKGFDFQLFFQGVGGNKIYNEVLVRTEGKGYEATLSTKMRDVWSTSNINGTIPNPWGSNSNFETSSRFVEDGSYIRLKNLQIGYTLPKAVSKLVKLNRCRLYMSASNLLTITGYTGYDPEVGGGVDAGNYPQSRTISFGINLDL